VPRCPSPMRRSRRQAAQKPMKVSPWWRMSSLPSMLQRLGRQLWREEQELGLLRGQLQLWPTRDAAWEARAVGGWLRLRRGSDGGRRATMDADAEGMGELGLLGGRGQGVTHASDRRWKRTHDRRYRLHAWTTQINGRQNKGETGYPCSLNK
jgi:hypothetical protein